MKIIDFKKTLNRIYRRKKNLGRAFMNWDLKKKGFINVSDIMRMSRKFGFPLNEKES